MSLLASARFERVPRGYEVAYSALAGANLSGRDCSRLSICALCAEDRGDAVRLQDGECPRCAYVDPYALEDSSESEGEAAPLSAEEIREQIRELQAQRARLSERCARRAMTAEERQESHEIGLRMADALAALERAEPPPPPFTLDTAHGTVHVTPLADGCYVFKGPGTFGCRETIKAASARAGQSAGWDPAEKSWTVAAGTDLREALPVPPPPPPPPPAPRPREEWSREEYQNWLARSRRKVHSACCRFAEAYETRPYGPICYRCERHGVTHNSWTGD